jgi:hypothetical protein
MSFSSIDRQLSEILQGTQYCSQKGGLAPALAGGIKMPNLIPHGSQVDKSKSAWCAVLRNREHN